MRIEFTAIFLGALAACGNTAGSSKSSGSPSTSVTGRAGGQTFAEKDAVGLFNTTQEYSGVIITDFAGSCALLAGGMRAPPSTQLLEIEIIANGLGMAPGSGTYTMGATPNVAMLVTYAASDANCNETTTEQATAATVTLDRASATSVAGIFDVSFANGDHLTGQFDAPVCSVDITNLGANGGGCLGPDQ